MGSEWSFTESAVGCVRFVLLSQRGSVDATEVPSDLVAAMC